MINNGVFSMNRVAVRWTLVLAGICIVMFCLGYWLFGVLNTP